ncbi:MAG: hypothetical protein CTY35_05365 [Methylotenera sp.]|nr:MAG: hypothetical protein CTY35_05365 [Methylotenera sp.]
MAITYVNFVESSFTPGVTSISVPLPTSLVNNNLLIGAVFSGSVATTHIWPAGWTVIDNSTSGSYTRSVAYRIVDGTESSPSVSWSTGSANARALCLQYSGILATYPVGDSASKINTTKTNTSDPITTEGINSSVIYINLPGDLPVLTTPSGWMQSFSSGASAFSAGIKEVPGGVGTSSGGTSSAGSSVSSYIIQIELVSGLPVSIDADATSTSTGATSTSGALGIPAPASSSGTASSESSYTFALGVFASSSGVVNGSISVVREKIAEALSEGELQDDLLVGFLANADALSVAIDASQVEVTRFTANVVNTGVTISGTASASRIYYEIGSSNATIGGTVDVLRTINVSVIASALLASGAIGNARYNLVAESLAQLISGIIYVNDYMDGWAYNLNIQAPSFYENFKFNSFAKIGNQYYGLNNEGLHLLGANDDNGAEIDALITTGISDFGELRTKKIPVIYAGARTEKPLILTCSVDNNPDYSYEFISSSEGIAPTRVKLGKGLEGRYWKLEIANRDGGDFEISDFDIPITLNSRGV